MTTTGSWEDIWDVLNGELTGLAGRLALRNPKLRWTVGHLESKAFPFTGYLALSREGIAGQEDVVVSVGVRNEGDTLRWTSDIATGEGEVLADGPGFTTPTAGDPSWSVQALSETIRFLSAQESLLADLVATP